MKKIMTGAVLALIAGAGAYAVAQNIDGAAAPAPAEAAPAAPISIEKAHEILSYSQGHMIGTQVKGIKEIKPDQVLAGLNDALAGKANKFTEADINNAMMIMQADMLRKQTEAKTKAEAEKPAAKAMIDALLKEDLKTTASGLKYKVITEGKGANPTAADTVKVHYTGYLMDGTKFDSSVDRGEPIEFPLGGVIPGWTEGVQLMNVGSKFKFVIPSKLGYAEDGAGPIPPNADLVFEVELLGFRK